MIKFLIHLCKLHGFSIANLFYQQFSAYSVEGEVKGPPVYVNYGRREDFEKMSDFGIDLTGKVCLVRYGQIFRGNKARYAEDFGCIALGTVF